MKQAVLLVVVFLSCCVSMSLCFPFEVTYEANCPNAKYRIPDYKVHFICWNIKEDRPWDPCEFNMKYGKFGALFDEEVPEDPEPVFYEMLLTGDGINATASGRVFAEFLDYKGKIVVLVYTEMEGDLPVGHNGTATVSIYFNEQKKDIPDWCVWKNFTIVSKEGEYYII